MTAYLSTTGYTAPLRFQTFEKIIVKTSDYPRVLTGSAREFSYDRRVLTAMTRQIPSSNRRTDNSCVPQKTKVCPTVGSWAGRWVATVSGHLTVLGYTRANTCCACSRCGMGGLVVCFLSSILSSFSSPFLRGHGLT